MNFIVSTLSSAPSMEGFGSAALANIIGRPFIWSSAAIAALAFTIVSNPAEIWARGSEHHAVRDQLQGTIKPSLIQAFKENSKEWEGKDKTAFEEHRMKPAYAAIDSHAEQLDSLGRQHHVIAGALQAAGILSGMVGSAVLVQAVVVRMASSNPITGPLAGPAIAVANAFAETNKKLLTRAVQKLYNLAEILQKLLTLSKKKMMIAAGLGFGAISVVPMLGGGMPGMPGDKDKPKDWPTLDA